MSGEPRGLKKEDVDQLEQDIRRKDPISQGHRLPVYVGSKEAIEESLFPWLRRRRRYRRR